MNYQEALELCLESIRQGKEPEAAISAHPEYADRLREDTDVVAVVQAYAARSAEPSLESSQRARQRLAGELVAARAQRQREAAPFWRFPMLRGLAFAVVAVVAVGLFALASGIVSGPQTAEADTIDGVVVENIDGGFVVQTESGLRTVSLDSSSAVTDENGSSVEAASLEAGQVVVVRVQRVAGALKAVAVKTRPVGSLAEWCVRYPLRCQEVEPKLPRAVLACQAVPSACDLPQPAPTPRAAVTCLTNPERCPTPAAVPNTPRPPSACQINPAACLPPTQPPNPTPMQRSSPGPDTGRLQEVVGRCQRTGGEACEELQRYCRNEPVACAAISGWLRTLVDLPDNPRDRLRVLTQRCQSGIILDCRELRLLCERLNQACPVLTPAGRQHVSTPRLPSR